MLLNNLQCTGWLAQMSLGLRLRIPGPGSKSWTEIKWVRMVSGARWPEGESGLYCKVVTMGMLLNYFFFQPKKQINNTTVGRHHCLLWTMSLRALAGECRMPGLWGTQVHSPAIVDEAGGQEIVTIITQHFQNRDSGLAQICYWALSRSFSSSQSSPEFA